MTEPRMPNDSTLRGILLGFKLREVLRLDLLVGVAGGVGAGWLAVNDRNQLRAAVPVAAALVGVVIGVVIATATIVAAFMNPSFLRKMRAINEDPAEYLAPYLLSGLLGTIGSIACVVLAAIPSGAPTWLMTTSAVLAGFFVLYALASMVNNLSNLVGFIRLQTDAAEVPDDMPVLRPRGEKGTPRRDAS